MQVVAVTRSESVMTPEHIDKHAGGTPRLEQQAP